MSEGIQLRWAENASADFLEGQKNLTIFLKDGYSFFKANAELLTRRLADNSKITTIIIVHPDSSHIAAVAAMDPQKKNEPKRQVSDCEHTIEILQGIRAKLKEAEKDDCAARVIFIGHEQVPTWNGFIGDEEVIYNYYTTRSHRGTLLSLTGNKNDGKEGALLYTEALKDCEEIVREAPHGVRSSNL